MELLIKPLNFSAVFVLRFNIKGVTGGGNRESLLLLYFWKLSLCMYERKDFKRFQTNQKLEEMKTVIFL